MQGASMKLKPGTTVQVKLDWPETRTGCIAELRLCP